MVKNLQAPCPSGRYWRVKPGDTLYLIALRMATTVEELLRLNPGVDPYNLQPEQLICLPAERPCPSGVFWQVSPGDTLFTIARAVGTTVERLMELNPHVDPYNLQIGQNICLP
ncbi:MAG: LysM peptidoglycan-binding domain-containing protein [Moorellaceae bacterium]